MKRRSFLQLMGAAFAAPLVAKATPVVAAPEVPSGVIPFAEQLGYKLHPVQRLVLKLLAGETPSNTWYGNSFQDNIRVGTRDFYTEVSYLNYLKAQGFYNGGTDASRVIIRGGRRAGLSTLGKIISLYEVKRSEGGMAIAGISFAHGDHSLKASTEELDALDENLVKVTKNTTFFYPKNALPKRLVYRSAVRENWSQFRGLKLQTAVLDNAGLYPDNWLHNFRDNVMPTGRMLMLSTGKKQSFDFNFMSFTMQHSKHPVLYVSARMMNPAMAAYPDLDDVGHFLG